MLLELYLEIPDMPLVDFTDGFGKFTKELNNLFIKNDLEIFEEQNFSSKDLFYIKRQIEFKDKFQHIRGPKVDSDKLEFFKEKHSADFEFYQEADHIFAKKEKDYNIIQNLINENIQNHSWSIRMRWAESNLSCVRPIKSINIFFNNQSIEGALDFITYTDKKFNIENSKTEILNQLEKFSAEDREIILYLSRFVNNPHIIQFTFKEKYLKIPHKMIQHCLLKEHFVLNTTKNECIAILNNKIPAENLSNTIEGKLLDLYLMYNRDIEKTPDYYFDSLNHKIINKEVGTVQEKTNGMKNIAEKIGWNSPDFIKEIEIYFFDCCAEVVIEYPELSREITEQFFGKFKYLHKLKILDSIHTLNSLSAFIPKKNKDPFGLKKEVDFLIENYAEVNLNLLGDSKDFFLQRLKQKYKILNILKIQENLFLYKDLKIDIKKLLRIINLAEKTQCNENIELNTEEQSLIQITSNITLENINENIEQITNYIDNNKIAPYKERLQIINKLIEKIHQYIHVEKLISDFSE